MIDLLEKHKLNDENRIDVLDHGFVRLVDVMPRMSETDTGDFAIVQSARVSYGKGTKSVNKDEGLIRYLMRHKHTTPFEHVEVKFHIKLPIFVARQMIRHRTANVNEYSGRYSEMSDECYLPTVERIQSQSTTNKQGTNEDGDLSYSTQIFMQDKMQGQQEQLVRDYKHFNDVGVARELSRINLPVSNYTEWYWKIDLHNLFHFLKLRLDSHAQYEIRVFAEAMYEFIKPIFPFACKAFEDYTLNSVSMSGNEMGIIKSLIGEADVEDLVKYSGLSKREQQEFINKLK